MFKFLFPIFTLLFFSIYCDSHDDNIVATNIDEPQDSEYSYSESFSGEDQDDTGIGLSGTTEAMQSDYVASVDSMSNHDGFPTMVMRETEFDFGYAFQYSKLTHKYGFHVVGPDSLHIINIKPG